MAIKIKCSCGAMYEDTFKFCPECATPNPRMQSKKPRIQPVSSEDAEEKVSVRKKFTKVGESDLGNAPVSESPKQKKKLIPEPEPEYEEEEDYEDEDNEYSDEYEEDYEDEDDSEEYEEGEDEYYEENSEDEEDEEPEDDEDYEDEDDYVVEAPAYRSTAKTLGAPSAKSLKNSSSPSKMLETKKISSTKSSLNKKKNSYDPNFDGYYDDRLPAILDEVTKTSHLDVILKISFAIICIVALIVYCIFYVQV